MDDSNFQQQLHTLKDRVNALTLQYSPKPAYVAPASPMLLPSASGDAFTAQLNDVKAHLNKLQASLSKCEASMRQQPQGPGVGDMVVQNRLTLPSGPVFWQLFNSLRSDFQGLDTRVAGLEQDVDALEDRVDRLEPDRFTPPGSTASQDENGGVQIPQKQSEDLLGPSLACLPELCSEEKHAFQWPRNGQQHSRISSLQSQGWQDGQADGAFGWQWPASHTSWTHHDLQMPVGFQDYAAYRPYASGCVKYEAAPVYPEGVAFRDREIDRMDDQLRTVQDSLKSSEAASTAKDATMADMQAQIDGLQAENQRMAAQMAKDARLVKGQETQLRQLRREVQEHAEQLWMSEEASARKVEGHLQTIADRDFAIRYWAERCEQEASMFQRTIADRDQVLQRWEESYNAASDAWRQENERAVALGSTFDEYRSDRRKEVEQIHVNYEREMEKLKEFCEHKDAVIVKQERVMARGGRLLEERDAEIDRLQRRLRVAEDDMQHEGRQQKRMARLLDETQTELERLRTASLANEPSVEAYSLSAASAAAREPEDTMTVSTEAVDGRNAYDIPGAYPQAGRRAHDSGRERRHSGSYGSDSSMKERTRNGSPRPRRLRRHESSRQLAEDRHYRHERRPSPTPRPHRVPDRENRKERFVADRVHIIDTRPEQDPDHSRARFYDNDNDVPQLRERTSTNPPPLPARVGANAARKMASEADLRNTQHAAVRGEARSLSKHQSLQELHAPGAATRKRERGWLQPYVETEGESEGERDAHAVKREPVS